MKYIFFSIILVCGAFISTENGKITTLENEVKNLEKQIENMENEKPGFIHNVYFWLKEGVSEADKAAWIKELQGMENIESVASYYYGPPAMSDREVVDDSFDYSISVYFKDKAHHDMYQKDQIHLDMIEHHSHLWERVQVYDNQVD